MTDRPIIFSAPMVRALLDGRKTQTRRVLRPQPGWIASSGRWEWPIPKAKRHGCDAVLTASREWHEYLLPHQFPCSTGDRLWVRETWSAIMTGGWTIADARRRIFNEKIVYRADGNGYEDGDGWWPSIHLPREFSRLTLTVTDVRVQRLQDINEADAMAEGVMQLPPMMREGGKATCTSDEVTFRNGFRDIWERLHGPDAWNANPWVVALTFTVQHGNIDRTGTTP